MSPSGSPAATHSAPGGPPSTSKSAVRNLKAQLISLDDLPAFWRADQAGKGNAKNEPACFATFDKLAQRPPTHAEASFGLDHHNRAELFENIGYVSEGVAANFRQIVKALDHCAGQVFSSPGSGTTLTGTFGPMAFPALGDDSKAYQVVLLGVANKVQIGVGVDVLLLRVGGEEVTLMYTTGGGAPQTQDFQAVVKLAYDKIEAAIGGGGTMT